MDIAIIGGGASGMMLASKLKNKKVTLFEKNAKLGKKLLLTGNGKCNFTNMDFENLNEIYNSDFAKNIYRKYDNISFINYFKELGIVPKVEVHKGIKYLYPNSNKATSVYYNLLDKIKDNKIDIVLNANIESILYKNNKYILETADKEFEFDKVVISTGGKSYKNTGSNGSGYILAKSLGHSIKPTFPGLCALKTENKDLKDLKGIRVDGRVIADFDNIHFEEVGEIQFTEFGISGIPIMNLSRKVSPYLSKSIEIRLDFSVALNDSISETDIEKYLIDRKNKVYYKDMKDFLCGFLPDELCDIIIKRSKVVSKDLASLNEKETNVLANNIVNFNIIINGTADFNNAQITVGGVDTNEVNEDTLESKLVRNLYFTGEVLDIDGKCGGYNLQLAYSTASIVADSL